MAGGMMLALLMAAGAVQEPPRLAAAGKWMMEYTPETCILNRSFGSGADAVRVVFEPNDDWSSMTLTALTPGAGARRQAQERFVLAPSGLSGRVRARSLNVPKAKLAVTEFTIEAAEGGTLRETTAWTVPVAAGRRATLVTGDMAATEAAIRTCRRELLISRGAEPAMLDAVATPAEPVETAAAWVTDDDYPRAALNAGQQGLSRLFDRIDATGRIVDCKAVSSVTLPELDAKGCAVLTARARYRPARDAAGRPVPSVQSRRIVWLLPR